MSLVIIGTGLAGYTLAKEYRKLDNETPLKLITTDQGEFYSKPMLSNALSKGSEPQQLVTSPAEAMAETLGAEVFTQTEVLSISTSTKALSTTKGEISYDKLVIANGASPIRLPMAGDGAEEVLSVNNLDDYRLFRDKLDKAESVAIIGPGLIGSEFASDLASQEKTVHVIGPDPYPVSTLLPEEVGKSVQQNLSDAGVQWHLQTVVDSVAKSDKGYQLALKNGSSLSVDLVLSAVGLRPSTKLAEDAEIEVNRGIVTNRLLETSEADVYALGDCAEIAGLNLPFVMPLMIGARALAKTLSGTPTEVVYPAMPVVIKTVGYPLVTSPPARGAEGDWRIFSDETGVKALFMDHQENLLGFALCGEAVKEKMALGKQLPQVLA